MESTVIEKKLMKFEVGKKYTIFTIGSMMAMTNKQEIDIKELDENGNPIFTSKGKRKRFILRLESRAYQSAPLKPFCGAVFEGWDQPFTCDTDYKGSLTSLSTMRGNACYNFVGTKEEIKTWIDKGQLNPNFDKTAVLAIPNNEKEEILVFPELYQGGHAVIDRIINK